MKARINFLSAVVGLTLLVQPAAWGQAAKPPGGGSNDMPGPPQNRTLKRNPFVPPVGAHDFAIHVGATQEKEKKKGVKSPAMVVEIPAPTFELAGILSGGGEVRALLVGGSTNIEAKVGDVVQGYKVTSINPATREVIVTMSNHAFKVQLPKETPYGREAGGGQPKGGGGGGGHHGPLPPPPAPAPAPAGAPGKPKASKDM